MESENKIVFDDDVLVEVLARLPRESVLRFKSVSPRWRDLLSSPDFLRRYAAAHRDDAGLLLAFFQVAEPVRETWESAKGMTCNTLPICKSNPTIRANKIPKHVGRFVSASNGLILCSSRHVSTHQITYHVGNPLTGKFVELPPPPEDRGALHEKALNTTVATPLLISAVLVVSEEDNNSNEAAYTVVRAGMMNMYRTNDDCKTLYVDSYSPKTGKWSPVAQHAAPRRFHLARRPAAVANGLIHWYTVSGDILVYNPKKEGRLQLINLHTRRTKCRAVTRTSDDGALWLGLKEKYSFKFYMLPPSPTKREDGDVVVDAKEWVLMQEVSVFTLSGMMKKKGGLVGCKHKEAKLECLIPESRSEVVAVLRQDEKVFLYNVQRKSLVKVEYSGRCNSLHRLHPYLHSSSLSSYSL